MKDSLRLWSRVQRWEFGTWGKGIKITIWVNNIWQSQLGLPIPTAGGELPVCLETCRAIILHHMVLPSWYLPLWCFFRMSSTPHFDWRSVSIWCCSKMFSFHVDAYWGCLWCELWWRGCMIIWNMTGDYELYKGVTLSYVRTFKQVLAQLLIISNDKYSNTYQLYLLSR